MQGIAAAGDKNGAAATVDHRRRNCLRGDKSAADIDAKIRDHLLERQPGRHDAMIREGIVDQDLWIALRCRQFSKSVSETRFRGCVCRNAGTRDALCDESRAGSGERFLLPRNHTDGEASPSKSACDREPKSGSHADNRTSCHYDLLRELILSASLRANRSVQSAAG